jgi:S-adenosylmethionine:tRNA ribosyltransferase-isomerase
MVLNTTRVLPARVVFKKETGGLIPGLILINEGYTEAGEVRVIATKTLPLHKRVFLDTNAFTVTRQEEQIFFLKPEFPLENMPAILDALGTTPIPPYIERKLSETHLRERYQTIFAKTGASVAAPTASLHFTETVFESLDQKKITRVPVTLDVGMGTFAPVSSEQIQNKKLHTEKLSVPKTTAELLKEGKVQHKAIIAVGTTVVRTLESSANTYHLYVFPNLYLKAGQ